MQSNSTNQRIWKRSPNGYRCPVTCRTCGKSFLVHPYRLQVGEGHYCSRSCTAKRSRGKTLIERFWANVDKTSTPDGCWTWTGTMNSTGYGYIGVGRKIRWIASRLAYKIQVGPIPKGMHVCHHCDNRSCVRGGHLFIGTNADNRRDSVQKGRHPYGERHGMAKATDKNVRQIRKLAAKGVCQRVIGEKFGMAQGTISVIISRKGWKHVT